MHQRVHRVLQREGGEPKVGHRDLVAVVLQQCDLFGRPLFETADVILGAEEGWGAQAAC